MFQQNNIQVNKEQEFSGIKLTEEQIVDAEINKRRWANRRRMSWMSFILIIAIVIFSMLNKDLSTAQVDILKYFGFFLSTIVLAYIGGNTIEYIKKGR